jgi:hypothetical protein
VRAEDIKDGRLPRPSLGRHQRAEFYRRFSGGSADQPAGTRQGGARRPRATRMDVHKSVLGELHTLKIYIEFALSFQWVRHFVTDRNKAGNPRLNREISMADPIRDR